MHKDNSEKVIKLNSQLMNLLNVQVETYLEKVGCNNLIQFNTVKNKLSKIITDSCCSLEYLESNKRFSSPPNILAKIILEVKNSVDESSIVEEEKLFLTTACNKVIRLIPYIEV